MCIRDRASTATTAVCGLRPFYPVSPPPLPPSLPATPPSPQPPFAPPIQPGIYAKTHMPQSQCIPKAKPSLGALALRYNSRYDG
eukprot:3356926-Prymnesium_polylepis.1